MTISRWMAVVVIAGLALRAYVAARDVGSSIILHQHAYRAVLRGKSAPKPMIESMPAPFWPRFVRRFVGLPWPGRFACEPRSDHPDEACAYSYAWPGTPTGFFPNERNAWDLIRLALSDAAERRDQRAGKESRARQAR